MRLEPVETPRSLIMKVLYRYLKGRFGKVPSPVRLIYARKPGLMTVFFLIEQLLNRGISLSPEFRLTYQTYVSMLSGCSFCHDARRALAVQRGMRQEKFSSLKDYRSSSLFDERERAALAFAQELSRKDRVSDETFAGLSAQFSEKEIVELAWMNAAEIYFNALVAPFALPSDGLCELAEQRAKKQEKKVISRIP